MPSYMDENKRSLSAKVIRNTIFGIFRALIVFPVPFILTPIILKKIGVNGYGVWAVFLAISSMTSLADLGLVGTLSKFVAEYYAQRDFLALNRLINTGVTMFGALSLGLVSLLWIGSLGLVRALFRASPLQDSSLVTLFHYFLITIGANIFILLFASVTTGLQRMDLTGIISGSNTLASALLGGYLLLRGWGLQGLIYGNICVAVLTALIYPIVVKRLLPQIVINPLRFDFHEAKKMFGFSLRLYFTSAAVAVHNQLEKILLARFVGVVPAGWYDIAGESALKIRSGISLLLGPVMPAASELHALNDSARLKELHYRAHKYLAFVGIPIVTYIAASSSQFVTLWLGPSLRMIALPLSVLLVVNFLNLTTGPGFLIFAGSGRLGPGVRSALLGIVMNVILSLGLIYRFGYAGAVLGTSISLIAGSGYFLYLFHRETGYSAGRLFCDSYLKPLVCSLCLVGILLVARMGRNLSWIGLVAQGLIFGMVYVVVLLCVRFFDQYDWSKIGSLLPAIRRAREIIGVA